MRISILAASILILFGFAVATSSLSSAEKGKAEASTYVGVEVCNGCHNGLKSITAVKAWEQSSHPRAMWDITEPPPDARVAGDFSGHPPFDKSRIAFVLGAGNRSQAYLDKNYKLLPAEWNQIQKKWVACDSVDGRTQCIGCHVTGYNAADGSYKATGVGCEMCHGPGSKHMLSLDKKETTVNPARLTPAKGMMVCGQCHSKGTVKGFAQAFPSGYRPGDNLESSFTLDRVQSGTRNAQYNDLHFGSAKHAKAGVTCVTCHKAHSSQLRQPQPGICTHCHKDLSSPQHGLETIQSGKCSICHMPKGTHKLE